MDIKPILRTTLIAQSLALAGENLKLVRKKKLKSKDFLSVGVKNIVGASLIKEQTELIEGL